MDDPTAWLARLAGRDLPGATDPGPPPAPVVALVTAARREKLVGVLAAAVADGSVDGGEELRAAAGEAHEGVMREALLLEEMLLEAVTVLDGAGVDHRVLKGAALAHLVHPDPAERSFGDNDVLVPAAAVDEAVAALEAAGATRVSPPVAPGFDRRFAKSVTLCWRAGTELDLHRTLAPGPYGFLVDLDDLWRDPVPLVLAGRELRTLPPTTHLLHAALHVALGDVAPRLGNCRDVALLARHTGVDATTTGSTARRWGCVAPVARGLAATTVLGHEPSELERWGAEVPVGRLDRRRLASYSQRDGRYRRQALASLGVLGWRDRAAFSLALLRARRSAPAR